MVKELKHKLLFSMISVFLVLFLSSCDIPKADKLKDIKDRGYAHYEDVKNILYESKDDNQALDKLETYLTEENFSIYTKNNNIFINFSEKDKYKDNLLMVILNNEEKKESAKSIATLLSLLESNEEKNLRAIVTTISDSNKIGIKSIDDEKLESKEIILIEAKDRERLIIGSVFVDKINLWKNIISVKPSGEVAYKIGINGFEAVNSGDRTNKHINPIDYIADILLRAQNADINIEISNFKNEGSIYEFPKSSEAIVVIDKSSEDKFEERLEKAKESFQEKVKDNDTMAFFNYEKVSLPEWVLDYDTSRQLVSAIYTTEDGVFKTEREDFEGDILGIFSLSYINLDKDKLELGILSRSANELTRNEMIENYKSTAYVLEYEISSEVLYDGWNTGKDDTKYWLNSGIAKDIEFKGKKPTVDLEENQISKLSSESKKRKIINIEFDFNDFEEFIYNLNTYLTKK